MPTGPLPYHGLPLACDGRPPRRPWRRLRVSGSIHRALCRTRRPLPTLGQLMKIGPQLVHFGLQPLVVLLQQSLGPGWQFNKIKN